MSKTSLYEKLAGILLVYSPIPDVLAVNILMFRFCIKQNFKHFFFLSAAQMSPVLINLKLV